MQLTVVAAQAKEAAGPGVDWRAAVRAGQRLAPAGPAVTASQAAAVVADLRRFSAAAELRVRETTGMGDGLPVVQADVVDRNGWIAATAEGMAVLTASLSARLPVGSRGRTVAGAQIGVVLGYLSGRVLGQYDPLGGPDRAGRLLLVAPNIVKVERELGADPADFRMWVCLHEGTHRLQFTAVPWLRAYFQDMVKEFSAAADLDAGDIVRRLVAAVRGSSAERTSWVEAVQTPGQRVIFDRLLALMTLLEGHADHVMDAVGPAVVPSVAAIRTGFSERRRKGRGPVDRILRALLGMDMKLAQYVKGAAFTAAVVDRVGMTGFNAVWTSAETLPTRAEIADPPAWVRRVLG